MKGQKPATFAEKNSNINKLIIKFIVNLKKIVIKLFDYHYIIKELAKRLKENLFFYKKILKNTNFF